MNIRKESIVYPLPDVNLIKEEEKFWRIKLPKDYMDFIMKYNGGEPDQDAFIHNKYEYNIERFLCILEDVENSEVGEYDISVVEGEIGERLTENEDLIGIEVLPIAELYGGDMICLDFRKTPDAPTVCIWDSEESDEFAPVTYEVAKSFTEFLGMLYDDNESASPCEKTNWLKKILRFLSTK